MTHRLFPQSRLFFLLALTALGCVDSTCPKGTVESAGRCIEDEGQVDGSIDDGPVDADTTDAGPCHETCAGTTPFCNPSTGLCVGCLDDSSCGGTTPACSPTTRVCVACADSTDCSGPTPVCNPQSATCVGCVANSDCGGSTPFCNANVCVSCTSSDQCGSPAAARCDLTPHSCAPCQASSDCTHLAATPVCRAGTCVACTPETEIARCGNFTCSELTFTCTNTLRNNVTICRACVADSDCPTNARCAHERAGGGALMCLLDNTKVTCGNAPARPYQRNFASTSVGGAAVQVCTPLLDTCAAFHAYDSFRSCASDAACDTGTCIDSGPNAGHCTISCTNANGCGPVHACSQFGLCGGP